MQARRRAPYPFDFYTIPITENKKEEADMTLIIALLREHYIVFASDGRHVRGDKRGRYKNDASWKAEPILGNRAMLGFAGADQAEEVIRSMKRSGKLETGSLSDVGREVRKTLEAIYGENIRRDIYPEISFLLAGFDDSVATAIKLECSSGVNFLSRTYDPGTQFDNFEIIGTKEHGALYVFKKCAPDVRDLKTEIRLVCFALTEVANYEIRVGGREEVCIIHPDKEVEDMSGNLVEDIKWSEEAGDKIRKIMLGE
jgi:20S proteasome alpha/beta subunit